MNEGFRSRLLRSILASAEKSVSSLRTRLRFDSKLKIVITIRVAHACPATAGLHLRELLLYLHMTTRRRTRTCVY